MNKIHHKMPLFKNEQEEIWSGLSFPKEKLAFLLNLYKKYQADLREVKKSQFQLYSIKNKIGLIPQLGDVEAEITYLLIREYRPSAIVEISPASGWSTSWILHALKDNGAGILHSYDLTESSTKIIPSYLSENRWIFYKGDIKKNINLLPPRIDYLFIDSDHSAGFALWYLENIFPIYGTDTNISVHDILKYTHEPGWGEESNVLCSWLVDKNIPCMTASRALKDKGYSRILKMRIKLNLDAVIHPPDYNSMIFFSLQSNQLSKQILEK